ncbi:MAG: VanZ family protein [Bacteroidales bacterium]|nr:MAG: VanZ family protein [Bacteroidales bacterium]
MPFLSSKHLVILKYLFWTWLVLILIVSSVPDLPVQELSSGDSPVRLDYILHLIEYFILVSLLLFWRAGPDHRIKYRFIVPAFLVIMVIASLDEYHQVWIPGRTFNPMDMYYNYAGVVTGMFFSLIVLARLRMKQPDIS